MKRTYAVKVLTRIKIYINNLLDFLERREFSKKRILFNKSCGENHFLDHQLGNSATIRLYKDSILSPLIVEGFEIDEEGFIKKFLKQGDIFLDIGANIGLHSIYGALAVGERGMVYAFEPTPVTYQRLKENILLNKLENSIIPINLGISNETGTLTLNYSTDGHDAWNSFTHLSHIDLSNSIEVNVSTLDHAISQLNIETNKISLIKIDVEGWEMHVLKGAMSFMENNHGVAFLVEYTDQNAISAGYCTRDIYRYMENLGYLWFSFSAKTMTYYPSPLKLNYPYENLIAVKDVNILKDRLS